MRADDAGQRGRDVRGEDLRAALDAERAAAKHWRNVARQRGAALDLIRRRTSVRAVLALDRWTKPLRDRLSGARERLVGRIGRTGLVARALPARLGLARRRAKLAGALEGLPPGEGEPRSVSIVVVVDRPVRECHRAWCASSTEVIVVRTGPEAGAVDPADRVIDGKGLSAAAAAARGAAAASGELICFLAPTTEPLEDRWLDRLAVEVCGKVVAATPTLVHPQRPLRHATPYDLRVRMVGLDIELSDAGAPIARAREAGSDLSPRRPAIEVVAGSGACLVVDRSAYEDIGGLEPLEDLDAAVIDLCQRLRDRGKSVVAVPSSIVLDHRPTPSRRNLTSPITRPAWRAVVKRHGPALRRSARGFEREPLSFALTVATPSAKIAHRWGDWHLAHAIERSLRHLGHRVLTQTADRADDLAGRSCDIHVVLRGLAPVRRTAGQSHVLWVISHPEQIDADELDEADLVLVASHRFALELRDRTSTPVEVFLQATDHRRFRPVPPEPEHAHPVVVVAKTREVLRPVVADALAAGLRPAIYGYGWEDFVDPDLIVADYVANEELPVIYSSAGVLLNDHWETMRSRGFVSNRLFDALACGTPVISDHLPEIHDLFGDAVPTYRDPDELRALVEADLENPGAARDRAAAGRQQVLAAHTFDHRARELLDALARHRLDHTRSP